jgi:hypothetical protein
MFRMFWASQEYHFIHQSALMRQPFKSWKVPLMYLAWNNWSCITRRCCTKCSNLMWNSVKWGLYSVNFIGFGKKRSLLISLSTKNRRKPRNEPSSYRMKLRNREDEGSMFLWNNGVYLPVHMALQSTKPVRTSPLYNIKSHKTKALSLELTCFLPL